MKYSATPKAAAAINHAIHGMKAAFRPKRSPRTYLAGMLCDLFASNGLVNRLLQNATASPRQSP